ncbi:hypothetical protein IIC38_06710 [candidate division KSB1 bacterium]|nr:hypothetical protein [candidate division KSB1 bacterium]
MILVLGIIFFTGIAASFNDSTDREPGYQDVFDEICQLLKTIFTMPHFNAKFPKLKASYWICKAAVDSFWQ